MCTHFPLRRWLAAVVVLLAAASAGCGPGAVEEAESFLIYDRNADSGNYRLVNRSIETIEDIGAGNGQLARLRAGGQIKLQHTDPQTREEIADSMAIDNDSRPRIDYSIRDDGTVVPWDFHSTIMLSLYHHIERANRYFQGVGVEKSNMGRVPIYYDAKLQVFIPINLLTDNAAYAFTLDAFLIPPQLLLEDLPLAANRGVIVHEYSHLVFNRLVHGDARAPAYLAEDWPEPAVNRMRSIDEGVADIFAGLQTDDPNFISDSISQEQFGIDRDLSETRHYDEALKAKVAGEADGQNRYNPYELGSVIASTVWALRSDPDIADERLGKAVVATLREMRGLGPDATRTATFFNELHDQLPSGKQTAACAVFMNRLDAIRGDLTCDQ